MGYLYVSKHSSQAKEFDQVEKLSLRAVSIAGRGRDKLLLPTAAVFFFFDFMNNNNIVICKHIRL